MSRMEQLFKQQFNDVKKLISFCTLWTGDAGGVRKMVVDQADRLMLEPGEWIKTVDKNGNNYLAVGTPFGIFVFYQRELFGKALYWYETTRSLIRQFPVLAKDGESPSGFIEEHVMEYIMAGNLVRDSQFRAGAISAAGGTVTDGIPMKKAKPGHKHRRPKGGVEIKAKDKHEVKAKKAMRAPVKEDEVAPKKVIKDRPQAKKQTRFINPTPKTFELGVRDTSKKTPRGKNGAIIQIDEAGFVNEKGQAVYVANGAGISQTIVLDSPSLKEKVLHATADLLIEKVAAMSPEQKAEINAHQPYVTIQE